MPQAKRSSAHPTYQTIMSRMNQCVGFRPRQDPTQGAAAGNHARPTTDNGEEEENSSVPSATARVHVKKTKELKVGLSQQRPPLDVVTQRFV